MKDETARLKRHNDNHADRSDLAASNRSDCTVRIGSDSCQVREANSQQTNHYCRDPLHLAARGRFIHSCACGSALVEWAAFHHRNVLVCGLDNNWHSKKQELFPMGLFGNGLRCAAGFGGNFPV